MHAESESREPASSEPTWIAVLTPPGRGAVATVGVRGPRAVEIVARRFAPAAGKPLDEYAIGRVVFGRFRTSDVAQEELVVGLVAAGEVEVHCHGGLASVEAVAAALVAEGATRVDSREWTLQTEPDVIAAEAVWALAEARTERTAAVLLDQYRGALRQVVLEVASNLRENDWPSAFEKLSDLLQLADFGRHLTRPWRVVLAGRPNAGKSSLMNALLGYQRSIVFAEPGTTRDVLTAATAIDGWPIELADTAGLRTSGDPIEKEGVERALREVREADLVLLLCDVASAWSEQEQAVVATAKRTITVHHKCDLGSPPRDSRPIGIPVSSLTGQGIDELCRQTAVRLVLDPPRPGAAVLFTERQIGLAGQVLDAVSNRQAAPAIQYLKELIEGRQPTQQG
jgi:tRNA modification GTPase